MMRNERRHYTACVFEYIYITIVESTSKKPFSLSAFHFPLTIQKLCGLSSRLQYFANLNNIQMFVFFGYMHSDREREREPLKMNSHSRSMCWNQFILLIYTVFAYTHVSSGTGI